MMSFKPEFNESNQRLYFLFTWFINWVWWYHKRIGNLKSSFIFRNFLLQSIILTTQKFAVFTLSTGRQLLGTLRTVLLSWFTHNPFLKVSINRICSLNRWFSDTAWSSLGNYSWLTIYTFIGNSAKTVNTGWCLNLVSELFNLLFFLF